MSKFKVKKFKPANLLIGQVIPEERRHDVGRYAEDFLEEHGVPINRKHGPDIVNLGVEIKTRNVDATSPQTVADMNVDDIINTDYEHSHVFKKFQQQLRIYHKDNIVVSADIYDFSPLYIQELIKNAYEHARHQLKLDPTLDRTTSTGHYGYFERTDENKKSMSFRLNKGDMAVLEQMANSNYKNLFAEAADLKK